MRRFNACRPPAAGYGKNVHGAQRDCPTFHGGACMPRQRLLIALLVSALIAGCSKSSSPPAPPAAEASTPAAGQETVASRHFAGLLPPDTIAYARLRDAGTLKDRW